MIKNILIKNSHLSRVFSNTLMLYLLQISGIFFPLITFPYLTRVLGPENYGIVVFVNAFMIYFQQIVDFGFIVSGTIICSSNRDSKEKLSDISISIIQGKVILAILGFLLLFIAMITLNVFDGKITYTFLAYIPVFLSSLIPDFLFRGIERIHVITYRTLISGSIYTLLILFFIKSHNDLLMIPIFSTISSVIIVFWSWLYLFNKRIIVFKQISLKKTLKTLKDNFGFFISRISSSLYGASNVFVLGIVGFNNSALGNFGVANNLTNMIKSFFTPIVDSILPYLIKSKDYSLVKKILIYLMPLVLIGSFFLFVYAKFFIILLSGDEFINSIGIFKLMIPLVIIALPTYLLGFPVLGAMGFANKANKTVIIGSIFHLLGLIVLFVIGMITINSIIILTIITEFIILKLRIYYILKNKYKLNYIK